MSDIILQKEVYETVCIKKHDGEILSQFSFNPSDANIVERYDDFIAGLQELVDKIADYEKANANKSKHEQAKGMLESINKEIHEKVDTLLNAKVSQDIFSVMGALSPLPSGDYYFTFIVEQIGNKINNATGQRVKKMEMKIKKHTSKYHG